MKYIILTIMSIIVFNFILNTILENVISEFITNSIEQFKKDSILMNKIGGFRGFKTQFDTEKFNNGDTTAFEIQILGYEKGILFNGKVIKTISKWKVLKADTLIKNYE